MACPWRMIQNRRQLTVSNGVLSSKESAACWGANWLNIEIVENDAITSKSVHARCFNFGRAMEADIIPTLWGVKENGVEKFRVLRAT